MLVPENDNSAYIIGFDERESFIIYNMATIHWDTARQPHLRAIVRGSLKYPSILPINPKTPVLPYCYAPIPSGATHSAAILGECVLLHGLASNVIVAPL